MAVVYMEQRNLDRINMFFFWIARYPPIPPPDATRREYSHHSGKTVVPPLQYDDED